jgi:hypothetical protein
MADRPFPGFDQVYYIHDPGTSCFRGHIDLSVDDGFAAIRGEIRPATPVSVRWFTGRRVPGDFIWTSIAVPIIVSERVVSVLEGGSFTGWATYPVRVHGHNGEVISGYYGLCVPGRCGPVQPERSTFVETTRAPGTGRMSFYRGMYFDETVWDGSDLFVPVGSGYVFAVRDVSDALLGMHPRDVTIDRADLHERAFFK